MRLRRLREYQRRPTSGTIAHDIWVVVKIMVPFLGNLNIRCRIIIGTPKGAYGQLTTTHICYYLYHQQCRMSCCSCKGPGKPYVECCKCLLGVSNIYMVRVFPLISRCRVLVRQDPESYALTQDIKPYPETPRTQP